MVYLYISYYYTEILYKIYHIFYRHVIILELKIILIFQWCYLQPLLYIPTEIRNRGEIKPPGNRCQGKFFLSQQAGNLFKGKAVNPISDRFTAYLFAYLR